MTAAGDRPDRGGRDTHRVDTARELPRGVARGRGAPASAADSRARVAKLADAADLGSAAARRGGSSPPPCTFKGLGAPKTPSETPSAAAFAAPNAAADDPRTQLIEALSKAVRAAAIAGDARAMKVASAALEQLIEAPRAEGENPSDVGNVVSIVSRAKRGSR